MIARIEQASAEVIAELERWAYEPPYDFYDGRGESILDADRFYGAFDEAGALVGHYYFEPQGDVLVYGLGLRPDLTGRGLGLEFFRAGLEFGRERFRPERIVLSVAAFNERAIKVYERAGFEVRGRHVRTFSWCGDVEFIDMEERC